jgi:hypothetical protein
VARVGTANGTHLKGIRAREAKVLDQFVSIVSGLPWVERVLAEPGYEGVQIWTVIDAEPFEDEPRDRVYQAELEATNVSPEALVRFRLLNRHEYGDEKLTGVLPDQGHLAWQRTPHS